MICRYSWLDFKNQHHPVYLSNSGTPGFQADTEDFKKLFRKCQHEWRACIVWLANGDVWIWQNKKCVLRGGWQLTLSEKAPKQLTLDFFKETRIEVIKKKLFTDSE